MKSNRAQKMVLRLVMSIIGNASSLFYL